MLPLKNWVNCVDRAGTSSWFLLNQQDTNPKKIEFSQGFVSKVPDRVFRFGESQQTGYSLATTGLFQNSSAAIDAFVGNIYLMKGTVPTNVIDNFASRSTDVLIQFSMKDSAILISPASLTPQISNISTTMIAATQTGTASWFWVCPRNSTNTLVHQIIGTVGSIGSGADIEMNTSIVQGQKYQISSLELDFTTSSWLY